MLSLTRKAEFSAAHRYYHPDLSEEENQKVFGSCYLPHGHGHNYTCYVTVQGDIDPRTGMVVNVTEVKKALAQALEPLEDAFLTRDHPCFNGRVPTTENIAFYLWNALKDCFQEGSLHSVRVFEGKDLSVEYRGQQEMVYLTRLYDFCAAHRLYNPSLSEEENEALYGKCQNPYGHGHNYELEVTVRGEIDPVTGMCIDLARLDQLVEEKILQKMDHKHLNYDVPELAGIIPSSENLVVVIWNLLKPELGEALYRVALHETSKNLFEYYGEEDVGRSLL